MTTDNVIQFPLKEDTLRIHILHRTDEAGMFSEFPDTLEGGPREWPQLTEVYTYEVPRTDMREDTPHEGCFRMNNAVDGTEMNVAHGARSLSVGDVVKVVDLTGACQGLPAYTHWAVNFRGWKTIEHKHALKAQLAGRLVPRLGQTR